MVGRDGKGEPFEGETFKAQLSFRADRANEGYTAPGANGNHWVAGGKLEEPTDAREHAWRQYRNVEHLKEPGRSDDLHAYLPNYRRVRRVSGVDVEGVYMPSFSVGVVKPGVDRRDRRRTRRRRGGRRRLRRGGDQHHHQAQRLRGARDAAAALRLPRGRDPGRADADQRLAAVLPGGEGSRLRAVGPLVRDRPLGPAPRVVIEGRYKGHTGGTQVARFVLYVDAQTAMPLYYMSFDSRDERIDVGMFVGRWSEDRSDYRRWPGDPKLPVRVIDSVGESFANIAEDGGWRRESWTTVSTPPDDKTLKRELSVNNLGKGH